MSEPIQPIVPEGTPLPPAPVGVPPYPITPFAVWTWSTPVIPEFYWNIYSAEQRIKSICKEIGKIEAYLQYLVNATNSNIIELHKRIDILTERVAALEKKVEEEVARLDALIAQLRADLEQEIKDREDADTALGERIDQEILDRTHADDALHDEISQEVQDRIHADDELHDEISQEVQDRIHADDQLHEEISHRLLPTDIQAGEEISITRPDPNSNTLVIASTVAHSIAALENTVSGLQAALTAETAERRADDAALWTAVNQRIERGKILAGDGIEVVNDPDSSTVTISATGGTGGATEITGTAPITVTDGKEGEKIVGVSAATENEAGVITEARVKELAPEVEPGWGLVKEKDGTLGIGHQLKVAPVDAKIVPPLQGTPPLLQGAGNDQNTLAIHLADGDQLSTQINIGPGNAYSTTSTFQGLYISDSITPWPGANSKPGLGIGVAVGTGLQVNRGSGKLDVLTATENVPGIISEARVKALAGGAAPSLSAEAPLKLEDGQISLTKDPAGPVTSSSAGLSVREITPETESEDETGVVSKATIKSLVKPFEGGVAPNGGLETTVAGLLAVKFGSEYSNIGVDADGAVTLVGYTTQLHADTKTIAEPVGEPTPITDWTDGFWDGRPDFIQDTQSPDNGSDAAEFVLSSGVFEVQKAGSKTWTKAELGTFELVSIPDRLRDNGAAKGYPDYHSLYARITPYGQSFYTPSTTEEEGGREKIQGLRVHYAYYNIYALPTEEAE